MNLSWLTDIHLNFLAEQGREVFYQEIINNNCDAVVISGDIADAPILSVVLKEMAASIKKPIYFVLGNHDYYDGKVEKIKTEVGQLCDQHPLLHWLPQEKKLQLNSQTLLLGIDSWADGRYGDYQNSDIVLNDSYLIYELAMAAKKGRNQLLKKMQELADFSAQKLEKNLADSITPKIKKIIILTHVSPFAGSTWHQGKISAPNWMPFYASKITGEVILAAAQKYSGVNFLILCGHSHSQGSYQPLPNLLVKSGKAEYYHPEIQEIISV